MKILGINAFMLTLLLILVNGDILCAIEEERLTRLKHWAAFKIISEACPKKFKN